MPKGWAQVMVWGGLRGSLSMVLVLTLPAEFAGRNLLVALVFGVVGLSLFLQGLTIGPLLDRLGLGGDDRAAAEALSHLEDLGRDVLAEELVRKRLRDWYGRRHDVAVEEARSHAGRTARDELTLEALHRLMDAERHAVREAVRSGTISASVGAELLRDLLVQLRFVELLAEPATHEPPPHRARGGALRIVPGAAGGHRSKSG